MRREKSQDKSSLQQESILVKKSPHWNYYLQDGIDMGTIMETEIPVKEVSCSMSSLSSGT